MAYPTIDVSHRVLVVNITGIRHDYFTKPELFFSLTDNRSSVPTFGNDFAGFANLFVQSRMMKIYLDKALSIVYDKQKRKM